MKFLQAEIVMEFRTIPNYDKYEITADGIVRKKSNQNIVKTTMTDGKYPTVQLHQTEKPTRRTINSLLKLTFGDASMNDLDDEEWRVIVGFPNYAVSNQGRVKNIKFNWFINPSINHDGYEYLNLFQNSAISYHKVHRLVAETFLPNPDNLPLPDHIDGNKSNNHVSNLRWATRALNSHNIASRGVIPFKGVNLHYGKYYARIGHEYKRIFLGSFDTAEEAAHAVDAKAREIYGEHARLNFP